MQLYIYLNTIGPNFAKIILFGLLLVVLYYLVVPLIQVLRLPAYGPVLDKSKEGALIAFRLKQMKSNPTLIEQNITVKGNDHIELDRLNIEVKKKTKVIRQKYIQTVFAGTTASQNGMVDAIIILTCATSVVKEIFISFNGRGSLTDLVTLGRAIISAIAIGGSEAVEEGAGEFISQIGGKALEGIPFAGAAVKSIADGYFNAVLISRIGLITENYCTQTYIEKPSAVYPSYLQVVAETKAIVSNPTSSILSKMKGAFKRTKTETAE
jgi:hypothetical protein